MASSEYEVIYFQVGDVLAQGLGLFARKFVSFYAIGLIYYVMMGVLAVVIDVVAEREGAAPMALTMLIGLLMIMLQPVPLAAITYGTYQEMRGRQAGAGECVAHGLRCLFPVLGVWVLCYLVIGSGLMLLLIPGLFFLTMLWVAIPVVVIELPGVNASLWRSCELTRGYRLTILGIVFAYTLLVGLIVAAFHQFELLLAFIAIPLHMLLAVLPTVSYVHLRRVKEGVPINELAEKTGSKPL